MKHWIAATLGVLAAMALLVAGTGSAATLATEAPPLPDETAQRALVRQSVHDFVHSITAADMSHFHRTISRRWQAEISVEALQQAFQELIDGGADWSELDRLQPSLPEAARVDANGVLLIVAEYPTEPNRVRVQLAFVPEDDHWKLLGFHLRMIVPDAPAKGADTERAQAGA